MPGIILRPKQSFWVGIMFRYFMANKRAWRVSQEGRAFFDLFLESNEDIVLEMASLFSWIKLHVVSEDKLYRTFLNERGVH